MRVTYPLTLTFKFLTISSYIRVVDATGQLVGYVKANKIIDIGATYSISTPEGRTSPATPSASYTSRTPG